MSSVTRLSVAQEALTTNNITNRFAAETWVEDAAAKLPQKADRRFFTGEKKAEAARAIFNEVVEGLGGQVDAKGTVRFERGGFTQEDVLKHIDTLVENAEKSIKALGSKSLWNSVGALAGMAFAPISLGGGGAVALFFTARSGRAAFQLPEAHFELEHLRALRSSIETTLRS